MVCWDSKTLILMKCRNDVSKSHGQGIGRHLSLMFRVQIHLAIQTPLSTIYLTISIVVFVVESNDV